MPLVHVTEMNRLGGVADAATTLSESSKGSMPMARPSALRKARLEYRSRRSGVIGAPPPFQAFGSGTSATVAIATTSSRMSRMLLLKALAAASRDVASSGVSKRPRP